jgi:peptidoglycan/LPS O-acetylase OafA/YrhL
MQPMHIIALDDRFSRFTNWLHNIDSQDQMKLKHRPEIDGMRAIAVLSVVLFHAHFPFLPGGFLGVDVFFVISGFLITTLIARDLDRDKFSLLQFYVRRMRRILPALFVVLSCSVVPAWLWLNPTELTAFGDSLRHTVFFNSNYYFWSVSGYFDAASDFKPLLHTWSLAVEEQYYIVFPVLLLGLWRLGRTWVLTILSILALCSFGLSEWGRQNFPDANFFLTPSRMWEILIGALSAFSTFQLRPLRDGVAALVGLVLVVGSMFWFDQTLATPSVWSLPIVIGSALVLMFARTQVGVGRMLSWPIFVWPGLFSFSTYLWHQPLFAFARVMFQGEVPDWVMACLVATSFALGFITWVFVEQPFRNLKTPVLNINAVALSVLAVFAGALFSIGTFSVASKGVPQRFTAAQNKVFDVRNFDYKIMMRQGRCFLNHQQTVQNYDIRCVTQAGDQSIVVWGDSHAGALSFGLRQSYNNIVQLSASGCPPMRGAVVSWRKNCKDFNDFAISQIEIINPSQIILHARWEHYKDELDFLELANTISYLQKNVPQARITIIGGLPLWYPSLPDVVVRSGIDIASLQRLPNYTLNRVLVQDAKLKQVAEKTKVGFISFIDALCKDSLCQVTAKTADGPQLMVWDEGHMSESGSLMMTDYLKEHGF